MDRRSLLYSQSPGSRNELASQAYPVRPGNGIQATRDAPAPTPNKGPVLSVHQGCKPRTAPQVEKGLSPTVATSASLLGGSVMLELKRHLEQGTPMHLNLVTLGNMDPTSLKEDTIRDEMDEKTRIVANGTQDSFDMLVNEGSSSSSSSSSSEPPSAVRCSRNTLLVALVLNLFCSAQTQIPLYLTHRS